MLQKNFLFIMISIFTYTSYKFFRTRERKQFQDVFDVLDMYPHVDCPVGFKLYKLMGPNSLYHIQVHRPLVHGQVGDIFFRKCQSAEYGGNATTICDDDIENLERKHTSQCKAGYISRADELVLDKACSLFKYNAPDDQVDFLNNIQRIPKVQEQHGEWKQWKLLSYMFEVVKGPEKSLPPYVEEGDVYDDQWDTHTLLHGIFPGTLWCGFGNIAEDIYTNLGQNKASDSCCRFHDLCKPKIRAFKTRFHYQNPGIIPISHCACDLEFYNCLKKANTTASNKIGQIFFNYAKVQCFDFEVCRVCTSEVFGWCFSHGNRCAAELRPSPIF